MTNVIRARLRVTVVALVCWAWLVPDAGAASARVDLKDERGADVGEARLEDTSGGVKITATFTDLETGGATFTTTVPTAQPKNIPANTAVSPHLYAGEGTATTTGVSVGFKYAYFNYGLINE